MFRVPFEGSNGLTITHPDREKWFPPDSSYSSIHSPRVNSNEPLGNVHLYGRNLSDVRNLLTNLTNLDHDFAISNRDYGSSYILPVLKAVKYDNNTVPTVFADVPVNVRVLLNIIHLANFDSLQMDYTIDLEMQMRWFDLRLANNYTKSILIREMSVMEKIWTPDPYFVNSKYSYFHMVSFPNFRMRISPNGLVVYTLR
ncbi:unnamed protein product [Anisakis simplex]|uniref:Neur_chan_LBD domain-containing protein n=1 Tax=Anisakis simplex TaxID=6269 RepID=A0A0M3KHS1_ANISI|nr:unnamed protein product [Anisakis simplex]